MSPGVTGGLYLLFVNLLAFVLMGVDKGRAGRGRRRIPEKVLLLFPLLGGTLGGIAGMELFRHKTLHRRFSLGLPALLTAQVLICLGVWYLVFGGGG